MVKLRNLQRRSHEEHINRDERTISKLISKDNEPVHGELNSRLKVMNLQIIQKQEIS
jgi:hypothetical protein